MDLGRRKLAAPDAKPLDDAIAQSGDAGNGQEQPEDREKIHRGGPIREPPRRRKDLAAPLPRG